MPTVTRSSGWLVGCEIAWKYLIPVVIYFFKYSERFKILLMKIILPYFYVMVIIEVNKHGYGFVRLYFNEK